MTGTSGRAAANHRLCEGAIVPSVPFERELVPHGRREHEFCAAFRSLANLSTSGYVLVVLAGSRAPAKAATCRGSGYKW
jgi:hypothetical protein